MISPGHLWILAILLIVVLIVWGPGKLPDVGAGLGKAINEFRHASATTREEFNKATRPGEAPASGTPAAAATVPPVTPAAPVAPVPAAPVAVAAAPDASAVPAPAPIGAGTDITPATTERVAGEGDHQVPG